MSQSQSLRKDGLPSFTRRKTLSRTRWTPGEDARLKKLVSEYGEDDWYTIASKIPDRSLSQCATRWTRILSPNIIKGQWTLEDDEKLRSLVNEIGPRRWTEIANHMPGRVGKQCRERWHNHLDPTINKAPWTQEEDAIIMELFHEFGSQWNRIASSLSGRTDNSVKNHFNSSLKKVYHATYLGTAPLTPIRRRAPALNRSAGTNQQGSNGTVNGDGESIICQPELTHLVKTNFIPSNRFSPIRPRPHSTTKPVPPETVSPKIISVCSLNSSSDNDVSSTSTEQMQYAESPQDQSDYVEEEEDDDAWEEEYYEDDEPMEPQRDPLFQFQQDPNYVDVKPHLKALEDVLEATWVCDNCNEDFESDELLQEHMSESYCCGGEQQLVVSIPPNRLFHAVTSRHGQIIPRR